MEKTAVKGLKFAHDFGGIEINTEYKVSLICVFGERKFACGSSRIYSGEPTMVQEEEYSAKVFVQSRLPRSWHDMEYHCRSSGGHLVSIDTPELEQDLSSSTDHMDYWCGGNMCKNSPAPAHSMWSDGSPQLNTNFAPESGLDGTHCCIKIERNGNRSWWKGENCDTMLQGICEFMVEEYLDTPSDVFGIGIYSKAVNISWATDAIFWQPSDYEIEYCLKERLSSASLPNVQDDKCGSVNVTGHRGRHFVIINDLLPFSEYEFKVNGMLEGFEKKTTTIASARTSMYTFNKVTKLCRKKSPRARQAIAFEQFLKLKYSNSSCVTLKSYFLIEIRKDT